jgi:hypothetical protein
MKRILTSNGEVLDLDSDTDISNLPPDSIKMDQRTYGSTPNFSFYTAYDRIVEGASP